MGTHPIFESDFDCLTETMTDILASTTQYIADKSASFANNFGGNQSTTWGQDYMNFENPDSCLKCGILLGLISYSIGDLLHDKPRTRQEKFLDILILTGLSTISLKFSKMVVVVFWTRSV